MDGSLGRGNAGRRRVARPPLSDRWLPFTSSRLSGWAVPALIAAIALLLAACSGSSAANPTTPTGGSVIAASLSPSPSASGAASAAATSTMPSRAASPSYPLNLTDDEGNQVTLPAEPQKIVSLTPATTEIVYALGAADRLVADTNFDDYPSQATKLPHVATYTGVDVEKIVGLGADLVLAGGNGFNPPDSLDKLRSLGIPVLVVYAPSVDGVLKDIDLVGEAIGEPGAATALTDGMQTDITAIRNATASLPHPRTFYELDATKDIYGPADKSFVAQMVEFAGGTPITTGSTTVFSIPLEKLVGADPQVIVLGDANYGVTPAAVAARPGWNVMTAVKTGDIRPVDDIIVSRPGPRLAQGLLALARAIHPDATLPPIP